MNRSRVLVWVAGVLIVVSVIAGWIAIGRLASATERGMARTAESLESASVLATETASAATELQRVVGVVGEGLASTAEALAATRQVSTSVRALLDIASIFDRVEDLADSLSEAEASLAVVEIDLAEAAGSVDEARPVLNRAVASVRSIPAEIDSSIAEVEAARIRVGEQVWLWRWAIVAGGLALLVMLALIAQQRVSQLALSVSSRPGPSEGQP